MAPNVIKPALHKLNLSRVLKRREKNNQNRLNISWNVIRLQRFEGTLPSLQIWVFRERGVCNFDNVKPLNFVDIKIYMTWQSAHKITNKYHKSWNSTIFSSAKISMKLNWQQNIEISRVERAKTGCVLYCYIVSLIVLSCVIWYIVVCWVFFINEYEYVEHIHTQSLSQIKVEQI